jgi:hypothetical protein
MGILFIACALIPVLAELGILPTRPGASTDTPAWIGVSIGLVFFLAGVFLLSDAVAGGTGPDGQIRDDAPSWIRRFQSITGLAIAVTLAVIASWVAFGSGERHFSMSVSLPFMAAGRAGSDTLGRWVFGFAAVLMWIVIAGSLFGAARKTLAKPPIDRDA